MRGKYILVRILPIASAAACNCNRKVRNWRRLPYMAIMTFCQILLFAVAIAGLGKFPGSLVDFGKPHYPRTCVLTSENHY